MECRGVLPTTQIAYRKGLGTCDAVLCVAHTLRSALEIGQEARIVGIDFSAAFDRVSHPGILFKLCSVGVGAPMLSVLTQFLSNRSQYVVVDGCRSKLANMANIPKVARSRLSQCSAVSLVICSPARIAVCNTWSSGGTALCRGGDATSQLDLPSLTPLLVAGCG